jgi:predicted TIM-barrel fold metal-dependent hydrolase
VAAFDRWHGQINDLDSHLETPVDRWGEMLGPAWGSVGATLRPPPRPEASSPPQGPDRFWQVKDERAPGMSNLGDRLHILDEVGIRNQLVFPALLMMSKIWAEAPGRSERVDSYNRLAAQWTRDSGGRLRVAALVAGDLAQVIVQAESAMAAGARALLLQDGVGIDRLSPADPAMDALWRLLAEADACALLHIGGSGRFMGTEWRSTPLLGADPTAPNLPDRLVGPHHLGTMHLSPSNYLTCMIFGGVFDRHPTLRVGVIEYGAMWAAPLMELLEDRGRQSARVSSLDRSPREVFSQNLRFTPFGTEHVARQIDRHGLPEIYVFSTDYPHPEGGNNPHELLSADLAPLGEAAMRQFFVTNAELLLAP